MRHKYLPTSRGILAKGIFYFHWLMCIYIQTDSNPSWASFPSPSQDTQIQITYTPLPPRTIPSVSSTAGWELVRQHPSDEEKEGGAGVVEGRHWNVCSALLKKRLGNDSVNIHISCADLSLMCGGSAASEGANTVSDVWFCCRMSWMRGNDYVFRELRIN